MCKNHHRCEVEIAAAILSSVAVNPKRKTLIMNAVNLNHRVLEKHLTRLTKAGFLVQSSEFYKPTAIGQSFLEEFTKFKQVEDVLMKIDHEEPNQLRKTTLENGLSAAGHQE